jgi:hypothetical protein
MILLSIATAGTDVVITTDATAAIVETITERKVLYDFLNTAAALLQTCDGLRLRT